MFVWKRSHWSNQVFFLYSHRFANELYRSRKRYHHENPLVWTFEREKSFFFCLEWLWCAAMAKWRKEGTTIYLMVFGRRQEANGLIKSFCSKDTKDGKIENENIFVKQISIDFGYGSHRCMNVVFPIKMIFLLIAMQWDRGVLQIGNKLYNRRFFIWTEFKQFKIIFMQIPEFIPRFNI